MATIPGVRFDITGASGSQGLLGPRESWRTYVLPRGGYAAQDSTGTTITFDSSDVANRFAVNNWIQAGTSIDNIRQVSGVGGNSITVAGSALTISENDRVFLIGNTQPSTTGGSATYITPASTIYERDDTASGVITNSMITTDSNGTTQFFAEANVLDALVQDGDQSPQGFIAEIPCGAVEGISTSSVSVFGATVTVNAAFGVTGWATFGQTVTMHAALGVTGHATFGSSVTLDAALGVTGHAVFGDTITANGNIGVTGHAIFGATITGDGAIGITGTATFGATTTISGYATFGSSATFTDDVTISGVTTRASIARLRFNQGSQVAVSDFAIDGNWGTGSTISLPLDCTDSVGTFRVSSGSASLGANPTVTLTFSDGTFTVQPIILATPNTITTDDQPNLQWAAAGNATQAIFMLQGTPTAGQTFDCNYLVIGRYE